jgi:hypothetical protein
MASLRLRWRSDDGPTSPTIIDGGGKDGRWFVTRDNATTDDNNNDNGNGNGSGDKQQSAKRGRGEEGCRCRKMRRWLWRNGDG